MFNVRERCNFHFMLDRNHSPHTYCRGEFQISHPLGSPSLLLLLLLLMLMGFVTVTSPVASLTFDLIASYNQIKF